MNPFLRPRRSMLYVPGCFERFLNKARTLRVDSVIFDLGDSVLVDNKEMSRKQVVEAVLSGGYGRRELVVRVNDLDSAWGLEDVKAVANSGADAVLFPNIESKEDVHDALDVLDAAGGGHMPIMVMIESPIAVLRAEEIAAASNRIWARRPTAMYRCDARKCSFWRERPLLEGEGAGRVNCLDSDTWKFQKHPYVITSNQSH